MTTHGTANSTRPSLRHVAFVVIAFTLIAVGCSGDSGDDDEAAQTSEATMPEETSTTGDATAPDVTFDDTSGTGVGGRDDEPGTDDRSSEVEPTCYVGDETALGLIVRLAVSEGGVVTAATYSERPDTGEVSVSVAEGQTLSDGMTLQLLELRVGEEVPPRTELWQRRDQALYLAEDSGAVVVDCSDVEAELAALDEVLTAEEIGPIQPSTPIPAIEVGTYCFQLGDGGPPAERFIRVVLSNDGSLTADTTAELTAITGKATGSFSTPTEMVMTVERTFDAEQTETSIEVWRFVPLTGELQVGPLLIPYDPVNCDDLTTVFTDR